MAGPQIIYRVAAHLSQKGSLAGDMKKTQAVVGGLAESLKTASGKADAFGRSQVAAATAAAASMARYTAAIAGGGLAAGIGVAVAKGAEFNVQMERSRNTIAGTLQLYDHSAKATDQLGQNMLVAQGAMYEIQRIADSAPGELGDITTMFQNMLPGARAVTGDMKRIMGLAQNLALYTPTLTGGDFITSGAQMSRILTGGAGAEMDTWKRIAPVITKVGMEMDKINGKGKVFNKVLEGEKLTMAFNKLDKATRFALVEEALGAQGAELAKMYENSWEGASASFVSGWRKIAAAGTQPMFESAKAALIKANKEGGAFDKDNVERLTIAAAKIGGVLNATFGRVLGAGARGIEYLSHHWEDVAQKVYHGMQIGAGLIKAAFAYGAARMAVGAALIAASTAASAGAAGVRGIRSGAGALGRGMAATKTAVGKQPIFKKIGAVFDALTYDYGAMVDGVERKSKVWSTLGKTFSTVALAGVTLVPTLLVSAVALGALSLVLVAIGGVAAYVASRWDELSASVVKGLQDGTVTVKPLITAAMILWEKLKRVGESFIGGVTGATMMQSAINMAANAVSTLSSGVSLLAQLAAGFLELIAGAADFYNVFDNAGTNMKMLQVSREMEVMSATPGFMNDPKYHALADELERLEATTGGGVAAKAREIAEGLRGAAETWDSVDLKDLKFGEVEDMTAKVNEALAALFNKDNQTDDVKGPSINIGTLIQEFDLRGEDPDRAMVAWVEPIAEIARNPVATEIDIGGF